MKTLILLLTLFTSFSYAKDNKIFDAVVTEVVDGDTFKTIVSVGMDIQLVGKVRVAKYDAPEIFSPKTPEELALGLKAKDYATTLLLEGPVVLKTHGKDKYGRILSEVVLSDGRDLATVMKAQGFIK